MAKVTLKTTRRRMQVLMGRIAAVVFGLALSVGLAAPAPAQIGEKRPLVRAELIAEHMAARRGETLTVALRQTITPGWHTYWQNPGDSGEPTSLDWNLPAGITSGPIQWPLPEAIPVGPLTNYGYSDSLLLLTDITIPTDAAGQSVTLSAKARWLVCKDICVPEESPVSLTLPLIDGGLSPRRSPDAAAIAAAREALPKPAPWPVRYSHSLDKLTLNVDGLGSDIGKITHVRFFPVNWGQIANAMPQKTALSQDKLSVRMLQGETPPAAGAALEGLLALEGTGPDGAKFRRGYVVSAVNVPAPALATPDSDPLDSAQASGDAVPLGFGVALLFAFLGGLILNLMPCVFPVLSLKAYALAREASDTRHGARGGLAYLAGVLASFGVIAAGLMVLRTAGVAAGWGIQFQSPGFVLTLAALFLLLGLNMSGVFEFGGSLTGAGDSLTRRDGLAGSFFTGVLATAVATPCTAPFMGAAIGYAFAQPAVQATAVLMALGLGFALPMLLLSLSPALGRLLPKPGLWMVRFKQVMAFPLYATAAWLVWVLSVQLGSDGVFAAMVTLLVVAFAAWLYGLSGGPRGIAKAAALIVAVAGLAGGAAMLSGAQPATGTGAATTDSGPPAEAFTQARLDGLLAEGKPVFVNFTAAWCITCKVNERVALRSDRLAEAFRQRGITYLKGDWTNANPEITAMLNSFGRAGVPLYLLYSGVPGSQPQVLPQLLTESMVLGRVAELSPSPLKQANGGS
jgi:thiol:disulfide interchange protein/DsbC/DsbD-like thiol-disulfide interchange protein